MTDVRDTWPAWKTIIMIATSLPFLIVARVYWQYHPGIWPCVLFWCIALADEPLRWSEMRSRRRLLYGLCCIGALGNAAATIANGGHMPVLRAFMSADRVKLAEAGQSLWIPLTDTSRLQWLCDIYPGGCSLGDMFIFAGLLGLLLNWTAEKLGAIVSEPEVPGKRLPGLGIG